jgi:hypothetical protein
MAEPEIIPGITETANASVATIAGNLPDRVGMTNT